MVDMPVNIKDYVIKSRQAGQPDSIIVQSLKSANWPEDIIEVALQESNLVVQPVPEPIETPQSQPSEIQQKDKFQKKEKFQQKNNQVKDQGLVDSALQKQPKRGFCFLTLIALLFSVIPFIGLGLAMTSFDIIKKKNKSGTIIAVLALLINIGAIFFVVYILIQMLTLSPTQLEGVSKFVVEALGIL